ncbi:hypothetical protein O1611_g3696 [Lasiodiplodia mahajangana]|uniref:Uncharacterized protein n=1 Tax=Lasiodiplodia mahajangana TaxID=1108764 RepID=A0ACC2JQZ8_9PEZI|nr:hypothetical protein O1611_g3696 [Lasiodiplodia mahajangana]
MWLSEIYTGHWRALGERYSGFYSREKKPTQKELDDFLQEGNDVLKWLWRALEQVDETYYTERRQEENELTKEKIADLERWIKDVEDLAAKAKAEEAKAEKEKAEKAAQPKGERYQTRSNKGKGKDQDQEMQDAYSLPS